MSRPFSLQAAHMAGGYYAQRYNRKPEEITQPSANVRFTESGAVETRPGYDSMSWDLNSAGNSASPYQCKRYNVSFFAFNTSIKYIDHDNNDTIVDTGVTISATAVVRFEEYAGVVFAISKVDGCYAFSLTRLNGTVTLGAATIVTDVDGGIRANRFDAELSPATKNLRIQGTDEEYSSVAAGTFTLSGTASQGYADNAVCIVVYDLRSRFPKASKIVAWKESLNFIGLTEDTTVFASDVTPTTLAFTQFATALAIENILKVSGGTAGTELVGKSGILTNAVATNDYLFLFKEDEVYYIGVADVSVSSGARPPRLLTSKFGCLNEDSADDMAGNLVWITNNKRIMRSLNQVVDGGAVLVADENFDSPLKELLQNMDDSQSNPIVHYYQAKKLLFIQVSIDSQMLTLVYDNNVGAWCAPDTNKHFRAYFEIDDKLYATDASDDTIYEVEIGTSDDGADIESHVATGVFQSDQGLTTVDAGLLDVIGDLALSTIITYTPILDSADGNAKTLTDDLADFSAATPFDSVDVGSLVVGGSGEAEEYAPFKYETAVTPPFAEEWQHTWKASGDGHKFRIRSWKQRGSVFNSPLLTTH